MVETLRNAFKLPELRSKLIYTIYIVLIFRFGSALVAPFVDASALREVMGDSNNFFALLNTFSGGAFGNATIFALSISPYITSNIIIQLLTVAIPYLEKLSKEGDIGRRKINKITKYTMVVMAAMQALGYYTIIRSQNGIDPRFLSGFPMYFVAAVIVLTLTAGSCIAVWLGDQINDKGIGNGISIILFSGIISSLPSQTQILIEAFKQGGANYILVPLILLIFAGSIAFIIIITEGERRLNVQYAKRVVGRKMAGGQSSFIPIKVNMTGVMPIIFATSFLAMPSTIMTFAQPTPGGFWDGLLNVLSPQHWFYGVLYLILIVGFNYFYVAIQYNPVEIANNIKANNGAIPGIRPGRPTSEFIGRVISKITFIGAMCLGIIAVFPIVFNYFTSIPVALGGTTIIIMVKVAMETMQQIESQLMMRHHKGFLE